MSAARNALLEQYVAAYDTFWKEHASEPDTDGLQKEWSRRVADVVTGYEDPETKVHPFHCVTYSNWVVDSKPPGPLQPGDVYYAGPSGNSIFAWHQGKHPLSEDKSEAVEGASRISTWFKGRAGSERDIAGTFRWVHLIGFE
jgi:hypothetical protein